MASSVKAMRCPGTFPTTSSAFRALTLGKPLIIGRKTFAAIGSTLPGRETIVVTRDAKFVPPAGVFTAATIDAALQLATTRADVLGASENVAGGGEIYAALLDRMNLLHMTYVHCTPEGDAFFPPIDWSHWREVFREDHLPETGGDAGYTWAGYIRTGSLSLAPKAL